MTPLAAAQPAASATVGAPQPPAAAAKPAVAAQPAPTAQAVAAQPAVAAPTIAAEPRSAADELIAAARPASEPTQAATVAPRAAKARDANESVKRESISAAIVYDESSRSAPRPGRLPKDIDALVAASGEVSSAEPAAVDIPVSMAPSSHPPPELPVVGAFGDYEVYGRLAFGGMAEIFLARQVSSSGSTRNVVVKRILPHVADDDLFVQMFLDEARLAIQLSHPNICHIYEFGRQDNSYFMAMEWVNGVPLGKLIGRTRQTGGIPVTITVKIISHIAEALHYAHRARDERGRPLGIVHRDVSPQNIMVSYEAGVKLLDFGVAKAASQGTKTVAGTVKGKFAYMSPQHCMGQEIDARADIFSLGVCLYEALTSKKLYHRPNEYETMQAIVDGEVPSPKAVRPDLPDELDAIVRKSLAKSPADRYQTAGEMQSALEHFLAGTREVVGATRVSEYLDSLYHSEIRRGPVVDASISTGLSRVRPRGGNDLMGRPGPSAASADIDVAMGPTGSSPPPKKARPIAMAGAALALLALVAGGAWAFGVAGRPAVQPVAPVAHTEPPAVVTPPVAEVPSVVPAPTPPTPAAPTAGTLAVRSSPAGGRVQVDGVDVEGTTPLELDGQTPGEHAVRVTHAGYDAWTGQVVVAVGETAAVDATLTARQRTPTAPPGTLSINTRPWSKVYAGSTLLGTTPIGRATVPSGTVRLRLVDRDGVTHVHVVQVAPGGAAHVSLDFTGN